MLSHSVVDGDSRDIYLPENLCNCYFKFLLLCCVFIMDLFAVTLHSLGPSMQVTEYCNIPSKEGKFVLVQRKCVIGLNDCYNLSAEMYRLRNDLMAV